MPVANEVLEASVLDRAINDTSDQTVRAVLKSICAKNDEARKEAEHQLLAMTTDSKANSDSNKRLVSRYAFCVNCEKEFDVTTNTEKTCRYHPNKNEPTGDELYEDNWDEFDVDTDEMREDFPECFTFSCCDGNLRDNPHGCVIDFHQEQYPDGEPSKRLRAL
ncbi:hypothetical protein N7517_000683 [Penicillium concentricum]|uniref:C2H2-type domain-containing protein n=1 Tax=Penicillium concentricum TaxID=293559 RepID=A0A9W9SQQ4_9EURO|nr:uncharacterized protein N7517_000683 [Penicillium concentricum]KAJ5382772.1 hypothetical protein N7517_000683 [Penicillium concentricum]